jgi:hypothetical protein
MRSIRGDVPRAVESDRSDGVVRLSSLASKANDLGSRQLGGDELEKTTTIQDAPRSTQGLGVVPFALLAVRRLEMILTPKSVGAGADGVPGLRDLVGDGSDPLPLGAHPIHSGERLRSLLDESVGLLDRVKRQLNADRGRGLPIAVGG